MKRFFTSSIGLFRLLGFLEGISLLVLVFVAAPLNRLWDRPALTQALGPVHGGVFVLFVIFTLYIAYRYKWSWKRETWQVLASTIIPFATFYVDAKILKPLHIQEGEES